MKVLNWVIDKVYDLFEYVLMLLIVAIVVLVILWRLNGLFNTNITIVEKSQRVIEDTLESTKELLNQPSDLQGEVLTVNLPNSTSIEGIANILQKFQIINDTESFVQYMQEQKLTEKIVYGSHELKVGSTNEEVAKQITE